MGLSPPAPQLGAQFAPGTRLGRYELLATIGKGGMASVILARQRGPAGFEKTVVVKVIHPHMAQDRSAINMLLDEARLAAQIDHPNVVHTYELGEAHGTFYIVMEYLAGESFARVLKKAAAKVPPPLQPAAAGRIVADAAAGLSAAHGLIGVDGKPLDIVHRDVSPGNIVVLYNGSVKVVDFGIAKAQGRVTSTQDGELKGKYGYMSPEQIRNEAMDARSDVFSLGVVLWEALALRRLFQADNVAATLMQILTSQRVPPSTFQPEVPRGLDQITLQALAPDPRDRFQSMTEMHKAIEDAIWQSRTGASEIATQMQWWFSDRIEQRRLLLSRATLETPLSDGEVDQIGQAFNNQSGTMPPVQSPLITGQSLNALPMSRPSLTNGPAPYLPTAMFNVQQRKSNRRTVFAIAVLGTIVGVLAAVLVTGGKDDDDDGPATADTFLAGSNPPPSPRATPEDTPKAPETSKVTAVPIKPDEEITEVITENAVRTEVGSNGIPPRPELVVKPDDKPLVPPTRPDDKKPPPTRPDDKKPPPTRPDDKKPAKSTKELYDTGTALYMKGDFPGAEAAYKQILAVDRGNAAAYKGLGFLYQRTNQTVRALAAYRQYLKLNPNAKDAAQVRKRIQELEQ